jgi:hypothetical protein
MTDAELGAQSPHRPAPPHMAIPQVLLDPGKAQLPQARLAPLLGEVCLRPGSQASPWHGALPPGRPHPPHLVLLQQAPQSAGRGAKLADHLLQRPRLGDQPVHQVSPDPGKAELGHAGGDPLLGGMLALPGWRPGGWRICWWICWWVMARRVAGWVVPRRTASRGMLQRSSSRACGQARRSAKPCPLACSWT